MGVKDKKSVLIGLILIVLYLNLFKIPSRLFKLLHVPSWMVVYVIIPVLVGGYISSVIGFSRVWKVVRWFRRKCRISEKIFKWLEINGDSKEDRDYRRDFWIVMIIICLIALPLVYTQWSKYFIDDDINVEDALVISPTATIMGTQEECQVEMDNGQVCFVESELSEEDKVFIKKINEEYEEEFLSKQIKVDVLDDPSFEEGLWGEVGDCCNSNEGEANISLNYVSDVSNGNKALQLSSRNHCACVAKKLNNVDFSKKYILTFDYKGNNPSYCVWIDGDNTCIPANSFEEVDTWQKEIQILNFTQESKGASLYFYASTSENKLQINKYDNIQVYELTPTISFNFTIGLETNKIIIKGNKDYFIMSKKRDYKIISETQIYGFSENKDYLQKGINLISINQHHETKFFIYGFIFVGLSLILIRSTFNVIRVNLLESEEN